MTSQHTKTNKEHWEEIFSTKDENEVSWFQPYPETSLALLKYFNLPLNVNIIDVGGGDSHFVDALIELGYKNIYLLDISEKAVEKVKHRLGNKSGKAQYIISDIIDFKPAIKFDFWHDRAAFHFLISEEKIDKYVSIAEQVINPGGYLILGTFSEEGPTKCSGLDTKRYNEASILARFEKSFERLKCIEVDHITPFNTTQSFLFCSFRKKIE